ncbi:UDP-xylose:glucoside alpha-1,3-xylosyltransferase [Fistulifera solaris]|uniref:UDP-D-xylose:beta-D-glucoside alpha-1,3-D-xylosyltransferase n=1 Tax=Fistulifera solaris TaxID=1519565 RepID=A0A1Z5KS44_FISSO|nr:UDP-xylose:glucoside alpha-1,3-xylosyltransferase [Fistulifera solaris]|eukprot:GAX29144.1 UDP-xylose:glucoside alpha-1,3-xylosyltransferase [Fistulifera solaris]
MSRRRRRTPLFGHKAVLFFLILVFSTSADDNNNSIQIAIVACGKARVEEAMVSIRSAILSTTEPLTFHIIHDDPHFTFDVATLPATFHFYPAQLPEPYAHLFAPCAAQRLFLHDVLPESVHKVLYVDADTIFLDDVARLWKEFEKFSSVAAMAAEHEPSHQRAYYKDEATHPYYNQKGVHGLNSGVILLNLEKLRSDPWNEELDQFLATYTLRYHDQDLLNLYFYHHPERLHLLSCRWNYRTDHCFYREHCSDVGPPESGETAVIGLLHGSRGVFHLPPEDDWFVKAFALTYETFIEETHMDCERLVKSFETKAVAWIQSVDPESITNNCQAIALPNIFVTLQANCRRNKAKLKLHHHFEL